MTVAAVSAVGSAAGTGGASAISQLYQQQAAQLSDSIGGLSASSATSGTTAAAATRGADFAQVIGNGLSALESLDKTASSKAVQAATGDLTDVHDYVIAATEMSTATDLTTTLRNKALDAFNEIMRMQL